MRVGGRTGLSGSGQVWGCTTVTGADCHDCLDPSGAERRRLGRTTMAGCRTTMTGPGAHDYDRRRPVSYV